MKTYLRTLKYGKPYVKILALISCLSLTASLIGIAYIFIKPGTGWVDATETAKLTASNGANDYNFGISVSIFNDYVIVGSDSDYENGPMSGSAYLFEKPATIWVDATENFRLTASDCTPYV